MGFPLIYFLLICYNTEGLAVFVRLTNAYGIFPKGVVLSLGSACTSFPWPVAYGLSGDHYVPLLC